MSLLNFVFLSFAACYVLVILFFIYKYFQLKKEITLALENADEQERKELQGKILRAVFPPRFVKD